MLFNLHVHAQILDEAIRIAGGGITGYYAVANGALAVIDAAENVPTDSKDAIRAMAYWMPGNIVLTAGDILHTITTITWEAIGVTRATALETAQRAGIIDVIMAVCKGIIDNETVRLSQFVAADTTLPAGWAGEPAEGGGGE